MTIYYILHATDNASFYKEKKERKGHITTEDQDLQSTYNRIENISLATICYSKASDRRIRNKKKRRSARDKIK